MIRFENVSLRYESGPDILNDISFELASGSFHFLTGSSGAGKTSLLRLIFLANRPSGGRICLFDQDMAKMARTALPEIRRRIGVVFQEFRLLNHLTVYENVALPLQVSGQKESHYRKNILELLNWVGLGSRVNALPQTLSGGEQQRAAIARAVVGRPKIIIADEPTGNVDPEMGEKLMRLFIELNRQGTTILIATHDQHLWQGLSVPRLHLEQGFLQHIPSNDADAALSVFQAVDDE